MARTLRSIRRRELREPRAKYSRVQRPAHGADASLCSELMRIADDAERHGLRILSIALTPCPRVTVHE